MKIRTGANEKMTGAPAWSNVTAMTTPGAISPGTNRYVQFQAILDPDSLGWSSAQLKDVTIRWTGPSQVTDLAGTMTKGPDYGIWAMTVDGLPLVKGITIDLTIFQDVTGLATNIQRLTSAMIAEVEPRNIGK